MLGKQVEMQTIMVRSSCPALAKYPARVNSNPADGPLAESAHALRARVPVSART